MKYLLFACLLTAAPFVLAETEGKSKVQIEQESDAIIVGKVKSVSRFKQIDEFTSYYCAEIELETVEHELQAERQLKSVRIYYRNATKEGVFSEHAPRFKNGERVRVFAQLKSGIIDGGFALVAPTIERVEHL